MIGLLNTKADLRTALKDQVEVAELDTYIDPHPAISGLFIDWIPKSEDNPKFALQGIYVEHYAKAGTPIVIFDRHLSLSNTEYSWLKKFNITFCEPVVKYRNSFQWMPLWAEFPFKFKSDHDKIWNRMHSAGLAPVERKCPLYYEGPVADRIAAFDKYYKAAATIIPNRHDIHYASDDIGELKVEEFRNLGVGRLQVGYNESASTILIGSTKDYISGRLPDNLFDIIRCGCVPLLPIEHRFYCSAWDELVISNNKDLQFLIQMSGNAGAVLIVELMENLVSRYPEFDIAFTVDRIKSLLL